MEHSKKLAPSSGPGIMSCAHYKPTGETDRDSRKGTLLHDACELILNNIEPNGIELDDIEIQACYDAMESLINHIKDRYGEIEVVSTEQRVDILKPDLSPFTFGTRDVLFVCRDTLMEHTLVVVDLKSGFNYDLSRVNYKYQTCWYALGTMQELRHYSVDVVEWYIMPNRYIEYNLTFNEASTLCRAVYEKKKNSDSESRVINYHCRRCANMASCDAICSSVATVGDFKVPEDLSHIKNIKEPEEIAKSLSFSKNVLTPFISKLEKLNAEIKSHASIMMDNVEIPGYEKRPTNKSNITDIQKAFEILNSSEIITSEEFLKCCSVSLKQIIDTFYLKNKENAVKITKKDSKTHILEILSGIINTKTEQTAYIYNESLHLLSELFDGSKILFFRMINLAEDLVHEAPHIDGTATVDVNFYASSDITFVDSTCGNLKIPINDLRIKMYGNPDIIDAWKLFYKIDLGFQEREVTDTFGEYPLCLDEFYPKQYVLAFNYANCNIGMEVEVTE